MTNGEFEILEQAPLAEEYCDLRLTCGLSKRSVDAARDGLPRSLFSVIIRNQNKLIGMGRIVGDGLHVQIVDIAVHPDFQKRGLSRKIMERLMAFVKNDLSPTAGVSLFADVDWLYEKFGFAKPQASLGMLYKR